MFISRRLNLLFLSFKTHKQIQSEWSLMKLTISSSSEMSIQKTKELSTSNSTVITTPTFSINHATQEDFKSKSNISTHSGSHASSDKSTPHKSNESTEKKRKPLSSGKQKKFHRHFKQVPLDEEVINCMYSKTLLFLLPIHCQNKNSTTRFCCSFHRFFMCFCQ